MAADNSVWLYACPTCRARLGEFCVGSDGEWTHPKRVNLAHPPKAKAAPSFHGGDDGPCEYPSPFSVPTVSGGAFEMNRRRH